MSSWFLNDVLEVTILTRKELLAIDNTGHVVTVGNGHNDLELRKTPVPRPNPLVFRQKQDKALVLHHPVAKQLDDRTD